MWDIAYHLQRRIGETAGKSRQAIGEPEDEADGAADGKAGECAGGTDADIGYKLT